jgi:hypothetical protein
LVWQALAGKLGSFILNKFFAKQSKVEAAESVPRLWESRIANGTTKIESLE